MDTDTEANISSSSTTYRYKWARIRVPAEGPARQPPAGRPPALSRWPRREALTLTVKLRGGAEEWIEIRARGRVWRRPAVTALYDVLDDIWEGRGGGTVTPPAPRPTRARRS